MGIRLRLIEPARRASRRVVPAFVVLGAIGVLATACKKRENPQTVPSAAPPDRLATGEIAEGHTKAFALRLPQRSTVVSRGMTPVVIQSGLTPEELSNYVRARVATADAGDVVAGSARTEFRNVVVPAEPNRLLTIQIGPGRSMTSARSEMIVTDTTPPPLDPKDSEEDRWRKAGYTPQGKPLDPSHMQ